MDEMNHNTREIADELPPGLLLGPYHIQKVLGQGGFGVTYLALEEPDGVPVVIKESLPAQFAARNSNTHVISARRGEETNYEWATKRFLEEADLLSTLNHPNIVKVKRAFQALGTAYYIMPWVGGKSLDDAPPAQQPEQQAAAALHLLNAMLDTLAYLHGRGLLHRDIKPANILLADDGTPVLIDFGTARGNISQKSHTRIESPGYTPFEQMQQHGKVGPWSDLYALAATMIKLLTGETPEPATDRLGGDKNYKPLAKRAELRAVYPLTLLHSIDKGFAVQENKRWQTAAEWKEYLQNGNGASHRGLLVGLGSAAALVAAAAGIYSSGIADGLIFETPLQTLERRAADNDADALYRLALVYVEGKDGVDKDPARAAEYLRRAAEGGCAEAELRWATCLLEGDGVPADAAKAIPFLQKQADKGNAAAQRLLGNCYEQGTGVKQDEQRAAELYRTAAEQGDSEACFRLSMIVLSNDENDEKQKEVLGWLEKAAHGGYVPAYYHVGMFHRQGIGTEENHKRAAEYFLKGAEQGDAEAQNMLGLCYEFGRGVEENAQKAVEWYTKAADQGLAQAQFNLGDCYENGKSIEKNSDKALQLYQAAADQNYPAALFRLAAHYFSGNGVEENESRAAELYRKAAELDYAPAQRVVGRLYEQGIAVEQSDEKAAEWYLKAARQGDVMAQTELGILYQEGRLKSESDNLKQAAFWLKKAAGAENPKAMAYLSAMYYNGQGGLEPNHEESIRLARAAAEAGNGFAMAGLGICYELGDAPYLEKDIQKAVELYRKGVEAGSGRAMAYLGSCYEDGVGVEIDKAKAVELYEAGMKCGDPYAFRNMGLCYSTGACGKPKDSAKAFELWQQGTRLNHYSPVAVNLALAYLNGDGVAKDENKATTMLKELADNGVTQAMEIMGLLCLRGQFGIPEDHEKAFDYFCRAEKRNNNDARYQLGCCYENGRGTAPDAAKAAVYYKKAAESGHVEAQFTLGLLYNSGRGVAEDPAEANKWYLAAGDNGKPEAYHNLALNYACGRGMEKDDDKAYFYFRKAAEAGLAPSMAHVARYLGLGIGNVEKNPKEGREWLLKGIEKGDETCMLWMGLYYEQGLGCERDSAEALRWFRKSAEADCADAQFALGIVYQYGECGVKKDLKKAREWYQKAKENGSTDAVEALKKL